MQEKIKVRGVRWTALVVVLLSALMGGIGCTSGTKGTSSTSVVATQSPTSPVGHDDALAKRIDAIFEGTGATAAIRVIELPSGHELYAREADRPVMPASNMKLVTTAMALDHFGPTHGFGTKLAVAGDDLFLIGGGDPGFGDP